MRGFAVSAALLSGLVAAADVEKATFEVRVPPRTLVPSLILLPRPLAYLHQRRFP